MDLRQIAGTLWKWAWLIVLAAAVAAVSSWWVVKDQPPVYQTSATLMIGTTIEQVNPNYSDFYTAQQLAQTYAELIRREPVLKRTAAALGFEEQWRSLQGQVSASLVAGTQLLEIRVVDTDPVRAKRIADEVTRQLMATVSESRPQGASRQFIEQQVAILPGKIQAAEKEIAELQAELAQTVSAREIQDLQSQINTLQNQINTWRSTFAQYQLLLGDTGVNVLTVVEEAALPTVPIGSRRVMQIGLAAAIGMMLAVGAAFLMEYLDDTVKSPQDVERLTELPTFGSIIRFPRLNGEELLTAHEPKSAIAEGYRVLRTNLQFAAMGTAKSRQEQGKENRSGAVLLQVTSAQPMEGKTTTVANLGVSLAQAGRRVLVVDADLRRPALHKLFNLSKEAGLTSLLLDQQADPAYVIRETGIEGLRVLPSGPVPANPAEVLDFPEMDALLERLRTMADYVLLDSPPVLSVADPSVLAQKVDGVVLVVEAGRTRTDAFERAVAVLQRVKARVLGAILTKVGVGRSGRSYDYYYYYSSREEEGGRKLKRRRRGARAPGPVAAQEAVQGAAPAGAGAIPSRPADAGGHVEEIAAAGAVEGVAQVAPAAAVPLRMAAPPAETAIAEVTVGTAELEAPVRPAVGEVAAGEAAAPAQEAEAPLAAAEAVAEVPAAAPVSEFERWLAGEEVVAEQATAARVSEVEAPLAGEEAVAEVAAATPVREFEAPPAAEEVAGEVAAPPVEVGWPVEEAEALAEPEAGAEAELGATPEGEEAVEGEAVEAEAPAAVQEAVRLSQADAIYAQTLYAEAVEHYNNRQWGQAREDLLRLKAIDPRWPDLDALLQDVEQSLQRERLEQAAAAAKPKAAPVRARARVPLWQVGAVVVLLVAVAGGTLMYAGVLPPLALPRLSLPFLDNRVQTYINRGYDYFLLDEYEGAIESFNQALALDPGNKEAAVGLQHAKQYLELRNLYTEARSLVEQKSFDEAIGKLEAIIKIDPWYKDADLLLLQAENAREVEELYKQAMGYYNAGDWVKAASALEALQGKGVAAGEVELKSKLFDSYLNAGRQQIAAANNRSAIIRATLSFNSALALFPDHEMAQEERRLASMYLDGYTAYEQADWRQAAGHFSRICAARPDYAQGQAARLLCESYVKLGESYQADGQLQQALEQYRLAQAIAECDQAELSRRVQEVLALLPSATPAPTTTP